MKKLAGKKLNVDRQFFKDVICIFLTLLCVTKLQGGGIFHPPLFYCLLQPPLLPPPPPQPLLKNNIWLTQAYIKKGLLEAKRPKEAVKHLS